MTPEERTHSDNWKQGALAAMAAELASDCEEYRTQPIIEFNALTSLLANQAHTCFMEEFGIRSAEDFEVLSQDIKSDYMMSIVSALNEALPADHPYIVALVSDQISQVRMCSMQRKAIPGWRDMISQNIVPIVRIKNSPLGESGSIYFTTKNVEYICP